MISLTFDDGLPSHLAQVVPLVNAYGIQVTFYLHPMPESEIETGSELVSAWRAAAAAGHELGNHSLQHPCSRNFEFFNRYRCLEDMTLPEIEADVLEAQRLIEILVPDQAMNSFAYPCYQSFVGEGLTRQSYVPVVARHFPAARGWGESANDPQRCDLHYLWSWPVERMDGAQMVGLCERAVSQGRWGILTFHGIDEGEYAVTEAALRELCKYLYRRRVEIRVAPVATIAAQLAKRREMCITTPNVDATANP